MSILRCCAVVAEPLYAPRFDSNMAYRSAYCLPKFSSDRRTNLRRPYFNTIITKMIEQAVVRSRTISAPVLRCSKRPKISLHSQALDGSTGLPEYNSQTNWPLTHRPICPNWPKIESGRPVVTPHLPWKFHANRSRRFLVILLTKETKEERNKEIDRKQYPGVG